MGKEKCSRYGARIQDHKVADEQMLVGQGPRKRLVRQDQAVRSTRSSEIGPTQHSWQVREGCGQRCRSGLTLHSDVSDHRWGGSARQQFLLHCARHSVCPAAEASGGDFSTPHASSRTIHSAQGQWVRCSARCLRVSAPATTHGIDAGVRLNKESNLQVWATAAAVAVTRS